MQARPTIVRLRADDPALPWYARDISRGKHVYGAYDGTRLAAIGATAGQARRAYRREQARYYAELHRGGM